MKKYIKAKDVKKLYAGTSEFSLIDIREIGQHTDGHPFFSISIPYSIFEIRIIDLIPSKETLIILMDHNDGLSEIVEEIASNLGYKNIQILKNGVFGWKKAGFFLFKGIHVPSKAFGELVELKKNTPHIKPSELRKKINKKDDIIIIDGRPFEEFKKMNIPTGVCCPNMEIPLRIQNEINDNNGAFKKGSLKAELDIKKNLWFFDCHFKEDPVMPGCLGLDAMWQLVGFYLGWIGNPGKGRALGVGTVKFTGEVIQNVKLVTYEIDMKKIMSPGGTTVGLANGVVSADGKKIYSAESLKVGLFK